mmetsp:Transcript_37416/g.58957  ORF Transcript_37416/g.58957 Transcript_37416/m.58957 type:complete len:196 (-) Transcript_37416:96-683(-)|eukprot:CAMPEP_0201506374 /NCGR_PEP_ID=MMETSP0161_2-20130828/284_1 /ASSEMBLY_ACC=CAM_ASM_000251 /TAXON_ID=180227 /ORGANISM="Neoparamoeba aestuarina, Strain SoJaBio B1-5/56/2" /LENGTH=195 /DNA_ID=CAMNT_0047900439 /DNA_START=71 /DNA_END=658 /DNA_ORIENTATION=-
MFRLGLVVVLLGCLYSVKCQDNFTVVEFYNQGFNCSDNSSDIITSISQDCLPLSESVSLTINCLDNFTSVVQFYNFSGNCTGAPTANYTGDNDTCYDEFSFVPMFDDFRVRCNFVFTNFTSPSPSPSPVPSPTPSPTPSPFSVPSPTPVVTPSPTPAPSPSLSPFPVIPSSSSAASIVPSMVALFGVLGAMLVMF